MKELITTVWNGLSGMEFTIANITVNFMQLFIYVILLFIVIKFIKELFL